MPRTITVACKVPNGLKLQVHEMHDFDEPVMGGGTKTVPRATPIGEPVFIAGTAAPFGQMPKAEIVGGYALTRNVDADFFAKWMEQNKDSAVVRNHLIFAHTSAAKVRDQANDQADVRSGLEPIAPDTDPRIPRGIKTADEQKKKAAA